MAKAVCIVSVSSIRIEASHSSRQLSQVLYGETVEILETQKDFAKISCDFNESGFVDIRHLKEVSASEFPKKQSFVYDEPFGFVETFRGKTLLSIGSEIVTENLEKPQIRNGQNIADTAFQFLNVPYLSGGRSYFGIDALGFVQLIYKVNGIKLPKNLQETSEIGESLFFVGESEAGDLAFFGDEDGKIVHVGVMLNNFEIIHADEKVRIDALDSTGIYNKELKKHTYLLRVVKRILN
ncbi:C40 family peptidase [Frigoriflavimonas asaccharolytica]|uniref:Cell wall-associated NlpC family hydrolase n=1 Tax=Frigoriflavimonas asaccharolytica TaxID=2735899 RepID=A0A8J8G8U4_9FLAO|nr:SH3 domain-containing C40 family peptidase [Frigoriflavimonas asaccharolytica]NRS93446.1 cell wall-associated NlpC family hydrolase [Frigoriflavimonas asaccharolytica]